VMDTQLASAASFSTFGNCEQVRAEETAQDLGGDLLFGATSWGPVDVEVPVQHRTFRVIGPLAIPQRPQYVLLADCNTGRQPEPFRQELGSTWGAR
jgi:hypothetical protein